MLYHEDMPGPAEEGYLASSEELREWQATHAPALTVKVWLGPAGSMTGMTNRQWAAEMVEAQEVGREVPIELMGDAAAMLYKSARELLESLVEVLEPLVAVG